MALDKIVQRTCLSFEWTFSYADFSNIIEIGESYSSPDFDCFGSKFCFEIRTDMKRVVVYLRKYGLDASCSFDIVLGLKTLANVECKGGVYDMGQKFRFNECLFVPTEVFEPRDAVAAEKYLTIFCTFHPSEGRWTDESTCQTSPAEEEEDHEKLNSGLAEDVQAEVPSISKGIDTLINNLKDLLQTGKDSDLTVVVEDEKFKLHRAILGIRSPVFASMLHHDMKEKNTGEVVIEDFPPDAVRQFVEYLYTGQVDNFTSDTVFCLYRMADKYDVPHLKCECLEFIKENLSVETFCPALTLSLQHREKDLLQLATRFYIENLTSVITSVEWQVFLKDNPTEANELYIKAVVPQGPEFLEQKKHLDQDVNGP